MALDIQHLPLHIALVPEPVREVPEDHPPHAQPHHPPPHLDDPLLLLLGEREDRHPDIDKPNMSEDSHGVDEQHVLVQPNHLHP